MQPLVAEVIDAVVRKEEGFMGIGEKEHVEYIVKLKKGENLKILSKLVESLVENHYGNAQRKGKQEFAEDLLKT